jgi:ATP-binding cassette subfamily C (CFTR/MRP) protein 1
MKNSVIFSRLMDEYGNLEQENKTVKSKAAKGDTAESSNINGKKAGDDLMQVEERNTGAVAWIIYSKYLRFAGGLFWAPAIIILLILLQGAQGDLSLHVAHSSILTSSCSCKYFVPRILDSE